QARSSVKRRIATWRAMAGALERSGSTTARAWIAPPASSESMKPPSVGAQPPARSTAASVAVVLTGSEDPAARAEHRAADQRQRQRAEADEGVVEGLQARVGAPLLAPVLAQLEDH